MELLASPDAIEPVVAWRAWFVHREEGTPYRLDSVIHRCPWPVRQELSASCLTTRGNVAKRHFAPLGRCQCGIYGAASLDRLANYLGQGLGPLPRIQVVGLVSLWGTVLVHDHGWRGSHGYPARLWFPRRTAREEPIPAWEQIAADLADYGVPIEVLDYGDSQHVLGVLRAWEASCERSPVRRAA